ncbi:MAG TPA: hypothetical protein PLO89_08465 [Spirochaetota bacterium]|nr:hypothetical protein [Spirochaetota bacterium]
MACNGKNSDLEKNIGGYTTEEFKEVKEAFVKNFKEYGEIGASRCVYYKNEKAVDLWGGYKDCKKKEFPL